MRCYAQVLMFVLVVGAFVQEGVAESKLAAGTFICDITPPVNQPVGLGFIPIATTVEHPLLAKGVLLRDGTQYYVLCAVDWMEVHNSYTAFTEKPNRDILGDTDANFVARLKAAINLAWIERMRRKEVIELSCWPRLRR